MSAMNEPIRGPVSEEEESRRGHGVVEYFLILVLVAILAMVSLFTLSDSTTFFYYSVSDDIDQVASPSPLPSPGDGAP